MLLAGCPTGELFFSNALESRFGAGAANESFPPRQIRFRLKPSRFKVA